MSRLRPAMRRRLVAVAVVGLLAATVVAAATASRYGTTEATAWLAAAALPLGYVAAAPAWWLVRDGAEATTLGVANGITLARGGMYALVAGFLLVVPPAGDPWRWLPALLYGAGAALDAVDGAVARRVGTPTRLGERLDMGFDTLGFLVAPLVAVAWGRLPVWYLSLSAARYCYRLGCALHVRRGGTLRPLPESRVRRPLAGVQMAFIAVALAPVVPVAVVEAAAAVVLVPSLAVFCRDFLVVTSAGGLKQRS
ncbi:CDP-alcohol phosphatidyltransferase family protein [Halosegnis marinus]|uniref:CDP-alcohol phosphatidyltransferase family protein n=1 Tax=Halosegnis marinus TaxID=3034023 RepID=A0ABD5ZK77_9EURY|nr:CDP-alcohol phosphatidyltransferase family protein [Halosegnis sp. DT85]